MFLVWIMAERALSGQELGRLFLILQLPAWGGDSTVLAAELYSTALRATAAWSLFLYLSPTIA